MGRGFFFGAFWGLIVSAGALATASLLGDQPAGNAPPSPPLVEAPASADATPAQVPDAPEAAAAPADPGAAPLITAPAAPAAPAVANDDAAAADTAQIADTATPERPEAATESAALSAPDPAASPAIEAGTVVDPVLPAPQAGAPQSPENEADLAVSTEPAAPPAPAPSPLGPDISQSPGAPAAPAPAPEGAPPAELAPAPEAPETPLTQPGLDTPEASDPIIVVDDTPPAPAPEPVTDAAPEPAAEPQSAPVAEAAPDQTPDPAPAEEDVAASEPAAPAPAAGLPQGDSSIVIRRPVGEADPEADDGEVIEVAAVPDDAPALLRFAAGVPETDGRPLMSIILIDDGSMSEAVAALGGLPFQVSIAIDPAQPGATEAAEAYRASGFEVLSLASFPPSAQPADVEVILEATFNTLPEAVGMLDAGNGGLASGNSTQQVMDNLSEAGRGFVTISRGLNTALRTAEQADVPARSIYRDLDADGQDARVIRRFLDQAAFRARQDSGVVLLGRVRPDTISALILWGTANRAGQVALAPVSAVLRGDG